MSTAEQKILRQMAARRAKQTQPETKPPEITEAMVEARVMRLFRDEPDTWEEFDDHLKNVHRAAAHQLLRKELEVTEVQL